MFADSLAKTLAGQNVDVERAGIAAAATTADVLLPDLVLLAADAAQSRGAAVLAQLQAAGRTTPTLVISAAEAGGLVPVQAAAHVAYITPAGGVIDCAGRVRAVLSALLEDQSAGASLQKLADKVAGRIKATTTVAHPRAAGPAKTSPGFPTPLSAAPPRAAQISVQPAGAAKPTGAVKTTAAQNLAKPSAAPASSKVAPGKQLAGGAARTGLSLGPSARSLTTQPVTAQPPPAASANPPPRAMSTPSLTAKPAAASSASLPRGTAGQPPAAMRGTQAALTTSPAPARREVELPTLRPKAPPEQPPAPTQKAANDQGQPPEVKTAPRIPLRAKRAATIQTHVNAASPPIPSAQLSAARQSSDSEVEISLSDRPASLAPKLLPADTNPPPPTPPQRPQPTAATPSPAVTLGAAREPQAQPATRATGAIPRSPPEPPPQTNPRIPRIPGAAPQTPANARAPVEPAHPPATQTAAASPHSMPASPARKRLETAPYANAPATRITGAFNQSMPAAAPRNPLEPAPFAGAPATRTTGSFNQRMPSGAPRHPFDAAPREIEPERSASVRNMPSGAPRYPFDAAPRASVKPSAAPARAPRDPLTSAAPAGNPQPSASRRTGANPTRRTGRAPTDPFRAAEAPQPSAATPQSLPDLALSPAADTTSKPSRWRGAWVMGAVAAIGCSALWLYQTYDSSAAKAPGNAATGALSQTPPLNTLPVDHAAPPAISPQPTHAPSVEPEPATAAPNAERRPGSPRRAGEPQEADPTTAAGRARGLVDSGSAMLRQGRYGIAEGMYMKALQEVPEYPPAMAELVRVHLARKDGKEAVRWAELLVAKQSNGLHQLLLGDAQALRGNHSAAQTAWTKAAKAGNATAQQRLAADDEEEEEE